MKGLEEIDDGEDVAFYLPFFDISNRDIKTRRQIRDSLTPLCPLPKFLLLLLIPQFQQLFSFLFGV